MVARTSWALVSVSVLIVLSTSIQPVAYGETQARGNDLKSVSFQTTIERGKDTIVTRTMLLGPYRDRKQAANGEFTVRDLARGVSVRFNPRTRTAVRVRFTPTKDVDLFDRFRKVDEDRAERLEDKQLEGRSVRGYRIVDKQQFVTLKTTTWADLKTELPVQIERLWISPDGKLAAKETLRKFVFNKKLNESLFSLDVPEGYAVEERKGLQDTFTSSSN